ncbi:MAG: Ig-like domain-containing protein [Eubacteriales bacterium]|nr:Ig-like domain-containing protein [Eubacteriales bacterium]
MAKNVLEIEDIPPQLSNKVKQNLKFKTGNFVWKVRFNIPLDPKTVNKETMYVTNSQNQRLQTYIHYDVKNEVIEIEPLEPYATNELYSLIITTDVKSKGGQRLSAPVSVKFKL